MQARQQDTNRPSLVAADGSFVDILYEVVD